MSDRGRKILEPGPFGAAVSRLTGAYLGILALWVTWLTGVLSDVQQTTALFRGVITGIGFALGGRFVGYAAARFLAGVLAQERPAATPEAEPVT